MGRVSLFIANKISNLTNENIVEIEGWTMDDGKLVTEIANINSVAEARNMAKEYLEKHPLYYGKWDRANNKFIVMDIVKGTGAGPYKVAKGRFNLYFVGIQFYTKTSERNFPALMKKVGLSLGINPNRKQINMFARFLWRWKYGDSRTQITMTEARFLMDECANKMGVAYDKNSFTRRFMKFDKADGQADQKITRKFFSDLLWSIVYTKPKDVVIIHAKQKSIKQNFKKHKKHHRVAHIGKPLAETEQQSGIAETKEDKPEEDKIEEATE